MKKVLGTAADAVICIGGMTLLAHLGAGWWALLALPMVAWFNFRGFGAGMRIGIPMGIERSGKVVHALEEVTSMLKKQAASHEHADR